MDQNKFERLNKKRKMLQEEVRLKTLRQRISAQINHLEKENFPYTVYNNSEHLKWIYEHVPKRKKDGYYGIHEDFQIDAHDTSLENTLILSESELTSEKFKKIFLAHLPIESSLVVCYLHVEPEIETSVEAFLSNPEVFFATPENWIITKDKSWIIEYLWDQGVIRIIQIAKLNPVLVKKIIIQSE